MFFNFFQCLPNPSVNGFQKNTRKTITRFTSTLILSATFGLYFSNSPAANFSGTWTGGFFIAGNWTDPNWNFDPAYSGTFPVNNGNTFDVTLSRGTVNVNQDITINGFNMTGGKLAGTHQLNTNKAFNWSGGSLSGTGALNAKGGLELKGVRKVIANEQKLINSQVANWTAGSIDLFNTSQLVNAANATFNVTSGGLRMFGSSTARFINGGNLVIKLSDTLQNVQFDGPHFINNGTVKVEQGTARFGGGGTSAGSFEVAPNGRLNFSGGTHVLLPSSSITGSNVEFSFKDSGGSTIIQGAYDVANTTISGNSAIFSSVVANSITGTYTQTGGFLDGTGNLIVTGKTTLSGGFIQSQRPNTVPQSVLWAQRGLEINGNFLTIAGNSRVLNSGVANWTSGGIGLNSTLTRFENAVGGIFNIKGTATKIQGQGSILGGTGEKGLFVNRGDVVVNLSNDARPVLIDTRLANLGRLHLQGNKLIFGDALLQFNTGSLLFDIGGPNFGEFDVLQIAGNAALDGIIDITLTDLFDPVNNLNPYQPAIGETFDILTAAKGIAAFQTPEGFSLGGKDGDKFDFQILNLVGGGQVLRLTSLVPIPASLWLFISALVCVWRVGIRNSKYIIIAEV